MVSNSDVLDQHEIYSAAFLSEMMNWCHSNDQETIIVIWNENDEIIYISHQIEQFFEITPNDVVGKLWTSFLPDEQIKRIKNHFKSENAKLQLQNIEIPDEEGKLYSFNGIVDTISIDKENYHICRLRNVTYTSELKQILSDSEKLIRAGQLSAGLVHEIRNPLTSLKGFLQLVQAGIEQKEEYYKVMIGEIEKLEKITSELLQMAKPFNGKKVKESVYNMVDDVLFIMRTQTDMKDIYFSLDLDNELMTNCSAPQIKQVLINLIKNGAESMDKKGNIKITTRLENDFVAIDIKDEGKGIPENLIEQLNTPFFTTKQEGTGLGLVITEHILELHNGKLRVNSEDGNGTTFTILLPSANE